jgi:hypothetical protein
LTAHRRQPIVFNESNLTKTTISSGPLTVDCRQFVCPEVKKAILATNLIADN